MTTNTLMRLNVVLAALAGFMLRVFLVLRFPIGTSGDAPFYIELAWNWLKNNVYGLEVNGQLMPVDVRMPGYPAFLASIFTFAGNSPRAAMLAQVVVDLGTCFLIALIAARLAPPSSRRRVAFAALWLAALCPFIASYSAVVLSEVLVTFLTALALLILLETELAQPKNKPVPAAAFWNRSLSPWFLAGIVVGFGTLVRPETPLLLFAAALVLIAKWWRRASWSKLARAAVLLALGLVIPLTPWAARNWRTLHEVRFLAPRYAELPEEFTPQGFISWTNTWLWKYGDVYLTLWKLDSEEIPPGDIPASAFDSPEQQDVVAQLLEQYNETTTIEPALDAQFSQLARERSSEHPIRTDVKIPFLRSLALWFTPRVELLPLSGHLWPLREKWQEDSADFLVTLGFFLLNCIYVGLAIAGAWIARKQPGIALLIGFILIRTAYFARFVETPEPRYVLECYPAIIALAAQVFGGRNQSSPTGSG
jgi:4-amino-4-deoxy-L-arabinose transferase-like glycosyltransferase